jgi:hypothetical protein
MEVKKAQNISTDPAALNGLYKAIKGMTDDKRAAIKAAKK